LWLGLGIKQGIKYLATLPRHAAMALAVHGSATLAVAVAFAVRTSQLVGTHGQAAILTYTDQLSLHAMSGLCWGIGMRRLHQRTTVQAIVV
jgi:hypothetical protein